MSDKWIKLIHGFLASTCFTLSASWWRVNLPRRWGRNGCPLTSFETRWPEEKVESREQLEERRREETAATADQYRVICSSRYGWGPSIVCIYTCSVWDNTHLCARYDVSATENNNLCNQAHRNLQLLLIHHTSNYSNGLKNTKSLSKGVCVW